MQLETTVESYKTTNMKDYNEKDELVKSVRDFLSTLRKMPIEETKNPAFDATTGLFSINLPKRLAGRAKIKRDSNFIMVLNPDYDSLDKMGMPKVLIYLKKEERDDKKRDIKR